VWISIIVPDPDEALVKFGVVKQCWKVKSVQTVDNKGKPLRLQCRRLCCGSEIIVSPGYGFGVI
jgi:hypothetical protein